MLIALSDGWGAVKRFAVAVGLVGECKRSGFKDSLIKVAGSREDVRLVDLEELDRGLRPEAP